MNIDFKVGFKKRRSFDETETRYLRNYTFGLSAGAFAAVLAGSTAAVGAGASMYGANKQSKATSGAAAANAALQGDQNRSAWASYLMSRGVNPEGIQAGQIPTNPQPINAKLPLWAGVKRSPQVAQGFRIGRKNIAPSLSTTKNFNNNGAADAAAAALAVAPKTEGKAQKLANVLDPLNLTIGNNRNNFFDPLGLF